MRLTQLVTILGVVGATAGWGQVPPRPQQDKPDPIPRPQIFVAQRAVDLGKVVEGEKVPVSWRIENRGSADLVIEKTSASCGCTVVQISDDDRVIPPGGSLDLQAQFDTRKRFGAQSKSVVVHTNDPAEPTLKLLFQAEVEALFEVEPRSILNLHDVQRGALLPRTIEVSPGPGRKTVKVLEISSRVDSPFIFESNPLTRGEGTAQEVRIRVKDDIPLGPVGQGLRLLLEVDGQRGEHFLSLRANVVGDLTWLPRVLDVTRQPSLPGRQLAPVVIQSADNRPFDVLDATAGPLLEVSVEQVGSAKPRTRYAIRPSIRQEAPAGPFAASLRVLTSSLDQPIVEVPVFGIVSAPLEVEPPLVVLRQDGSPVGQQRRVKIQAPVMETLVISEISSSLPNVAAAIDREASSRYRHLRFLDVRLNGKLSEGTHEATLTVTTNIEGAQSLEIPVRIEVPAGSG